MNNKLIWKKLISYTRLKTLLILFSLTISLVLTIAVFAETVLIQRELYQERQNTIKLLLAQAAHLLKPQLKLKVHREILRIANGLLQYEFIKGVQITWQEPAIYRELREMDKFLGKNPPEQSRELKVEVGSMQGQCVEVPILDGRYRLGTLKVALDDTTYKAILHRWWLSLSLAGGVIIFLVTGLVVFFFRTVAYPVQKLAENMGASPENLRPLEEISAPKEIQILIRAYNRLVKRLELYRLGLEEAIKRWQEAAYEAQAASRAKTSFLANISHEIRTPMAAALGIIELLEDTRLDPEQRQYVFYLKNSVGTLQSMLNDILDFARLEEGHLLLHPQEFHFPSLIDKCVALFEHQFEQKGLSFSWHMDPALHRNFIGDEARILQILINLLSNSLKFTEKGGVELSIDLEKEEEGLVWIHFKVKDTGRGIAPEDQKRIFIPFERLENRFDRPYQGTGLGLSIVQYLTHLMGGKVWFESKGLGQGTVFHVLIPLRPGSLEKVETPRPQRPLKGRILLAEDNQVTRHFFKKVLEQMGFEVVAVQDGREAYQRANEESFDLYLLDLQMPFIDGLELCRRLRQKGVKEPIFALTAHVVEDFKHRAQEVGMDGFISKPISRQELRRILEEFLGG